MKKMLYTCLFLLFLTNTFLFAQNGIKFGFRAGYSMATQYGIDEPDIPYTVNVQYRHGFSGGLLMYFPVTEFFGMQQEFLYVQKGSREDIDLKDQPIKTHQGSESGPNRAGEARGPAQRETERRPILSSKLLQSGCFFSGALARLMDFPLA